VPKSTVDLEKLIRLIGVQHLQQWRVAELCDVSTSCVERWCTRLGLKTQRTGPRGGPGHPGWKGGRYLLDRYWYVYAPWHPNATKVGYIAEHRLRMSQMLGRPLKPKEVVHHKDGNPRNNSKRNLELFATNAEHLKHELTGRPKPQKPARPKDQQRKSSRRASKRGG
jgi:hypothetical protein